MAYLKHFTSEDILKISGSLLISPTVQICSNVISIEAAGTGSVTLEMCVYDKPQTFITVETVEPMELPFLVTLSDCPINNSIRLKSSGAFSEITFNL